MMMMIGDDDDDDDDDVWESRAGPYTVRSAI